MWVIYQNKNMCFFTAKLFVISFWLFLTSSTQALVIVYRTTLNIKLKIEVHNKHGHVGCDARVVCCNNYLLS